MNYLESLNKIYNVGIYIRLSREDDDKVYESESITNQKSLLLQYVKENNLRVYDIYIDDGYSGTNFDRPDFNRLLNDIELGRVNMVITKDMSRLGRDYIGTGNLIEKYLLEGFRVLLLAKSNEILSKRSLPNTLEPIGIILLLDEIRENAVETLEYFYKQDVDIKIISRW